MNDYYHKMISLGYWDKVNSFFNSLNFQLYVNNRKLKIKDNLKEY